MPFLRKKISFSVLNLTYHETTRLYVHGYNEVNAFIFVSMDDLQYVKYFHDVNASLKFISITFI